MAGGLQNLEAHFPNLEFEPIVNTDVRERGICASADIDSCTRPRGQLFVAGNEIGVHMGLENVADFQATGGGSVKVNVHVPLRVNHDCLTF